MSKENVSSNMHSIPSFSKEDASAQQLKVIAVNGTKNVGEHQWHQE